MYTVKRLMSENLKRARHQWFEWSHIPLDAQCRIQRLQIAADTFLHLPTFILGDSIECKITEGNSQQPYTIILSLLFWSWVLGSIGAILAIPLTLAIKNLVTQYASEVHPS
jgi:hypothetical protein